MDHSGDSCKFTSPGAVNAIIDGYETWTKTESPIVDQKCLSGGNSRSSTGDNNPIQEPRKQSLVVSVNRDYGTHSTQKTRDRTP